MTHWRSKEQLHRKLSVPLYAESSVFYVFENHTPKALTTSCHVCDKIVTQLWQDRDTAVKRSWHNWGRIVTQLRQDRDTTEDRDTAETRSWHGAMCVTQKWRCVVTPFTFCEEKQRFYIELLKTWSTYRHISMTLPRKDWTQHCYHYKITTMIKLMLKIRGKVVCFSFILVILHP